MIEKIINLFNDNYLIPGVLLKKYKELNITEREFILLVYLINQKDLLFNPKKISSEIGIDMVEIMNILNSLDNKDIIKIVTKQINNKHGEYIELDNMYNKLGFLIINDESTGQNKTNIFDIFEKEFGRTISPMEYEIINAWISSGFNEELILLGLKEAIYNGVTNLRYIDKILHEWHKKGIKTESDILKERKNFNAKKEMPKEIFDYDWLNESNE
ncbi:MAG TPA: DnaD domain protein [Tenericutes bacterium]|nr:DnaD domain protein [Mycoplasmatota bacterium]